MRSGKPRIPLAAKKGGEPAEPSIYKNVAEPSQDTLDNQAKILSKLDNVLKRKGKEVVGVSTKRSKFDDEDGGIYTVGTSKTDNEAAVKNLLQTEESEDSDECDWEEGSVQVSNSATDKRDCEVNGVTVEFLATPDASTSKHKNVQRRFTAEEKEAAELVHRVHLLCLVARGRIIDSACDDPLLQAALMSLLPPNLVKKSDATRLPMNGLSPLLTWFHRNFRVQNTMQKKTKAFPSALSLALEAQGGSPEEVVALSVALFRALNISARFVSILDVASLKPKREKYGVSYFNDSRVEKDIFQSSTLMVNGLNQSMKLGRSRRGKASMVGLSKLKTANKPNEIEADKISYLNDSRVEKDIFQSSTLMVNGLNQSMRLGRSKRGKAFMVGLSKLKTANKPNEIETDKVETVKDGSMIDQLIMKARNRAEHPQDSRRRGDLEFQLQMEMALAATAAATPDIMSELNVHAARAGSSSIPFPLNRLKRERLSPCSQYISTAFGCEKVGAPLCWAEVYCQGEDMAGKWVHVDVIHASINGAKRVEAAVTACKKSLRYVVAFARNGAKDVTRRYCAEWHKIASKRVNSTWWDGVLAPLKELESGTTGRMAHIEAQSSTKLDIAERANFEDMELETRALTEPLPTNQQAYKSHSLYAIERWINKYQILYPKGPVLGFVSGHAVYPRSCVKTLHTREMWLREGLQVRANELPVKIVKRTSKQLKGQINGDEDSGEASSDGSVSLYGKWQTEPLRLQPAVNGIVPKNERGQIDVWSEKCLPPGTVHLRLPRLVPIVERLKINFAPAMVGFEFRNGRSVPVYEGLVVCTEFKDAILKVYAEQEERREEEIRRRDKKQALSRWYQLLSSMLTRRRLDEMYRQDSSQPTIVNTPKSVGRKLKADSSVVGQHSSPRQEDAQETPMYASLTSPGGEHQHNFVIEDEGFHEADGTLILTKRCNCGFSIQVEQF